MSDTFVLEKRELLAGGAPPAVIFKFSGTFSERYGLMNEKIVQDESWQSELSENVSINKSNVILEKEINDFWQNKVIGSVSGEASFKVTRNEDTLDVNHSFEQSYGYSKGWPFVWSAINQDISIEFYLLGEPETSYQIDVAWKSEDGKSDNSPQMNWGYGYNYERLREHNPFTQINHPLQGTTLEYNGHLYSKACSNIVIYAGSYYGNSGPGGDGESGNAKHILSSAIRITNLSLPDIAISDATYDDVNKNVWFDMELKNNPKDFNVQLYQSEDQSFDENDDFVSSQSISSSSYSSQKNSVSLHLPDSFKYNPLKPYLVLVADPWTESTPRGEVTELEEKSNNVTSVLMTPSTDIKVTKLSFVSRGVLEVEYDITGEIPVQPIRLDVYRSESASFAYGNNQLITSITLPPSSRKVKIKGDFRIDPSRKFILAVADPENLIDENDADILNEDNSKSIRKFLLGAITHGYSITLFNYTSIDWMKQMRGAMIMKGYDSVLTHDWYEASDDKKRNVTVNEGYKFAQKIIATTRNLTNSAISINGYESNFLVDLHLIGHSRGAVVVTQAAIKLSTISESKLLFDHKKLTLLDPHPANSSTLKTFNVPTLNRIKSFYFPPFYNRSTPYNIWLAAQASINRYRSFCLAARDPNIEIPSFIDEAESYYQRSEVVLPLPTIATIPDVLWVMNLHGIPVKGAKNTEITSLRPVNQHSDVYNWYINHKIYQF